MIRDVYQKVYDEVMSTPVGNERETRECDVCDQSKSIEEMYLFPHNEQLDCCNDCRANKKLETLLQLIDRTEEKELLCWKCDMCGTKLGNGHKWYANTELDVDVCAACYGRSDELFVVRRADPKFRYAKRGLRLTFVDPSTICYRPLTFNATVTDRCTKWAHEWSDLVRVPDDNFVWMEWSRFAPWHKMKHYPAWTSLAVRCVFDGQDSVQIASLAKDENGCISVDVVCEKTKDEFLQEQHTFQERVKKMLPEQLALLDAHVAKKMAEDKCCPHETMMLASTDYSEYIRLAHKLPLRFGF